MRKEQGLEFTDYLTDDDRPYIQAGGLSSKAGYVDFRGRTHFFTDERLWWKNDHSCESPDYHYEISKKDCGIPFSDQHFCLPDDIRPLEGIRLNRLTFREAKFIASYAEEQGFGTVMRYNKHDDSYSLEGNLRRAWADTIFFMMRFDCAFQFNPKYSDSFPIYEKKLGKNLTDEKENYDIAFRASNKIGAVLNDAISSGVNETVIAMCYKADDICTNENKDCHTSKIKIKDHLATVYRLDNNSECYQKTQIYFLKDPDAFQSFYRMLSRFDDIICLDENEMKDKEYMAKLSRAEADFLWRFQFKDFPLYCAANDRVRKIEYHSSIRNVPERGHYLGRATALWENNKDICEKIADYCNYSQEETVKYWDNIKKQHKRYADFAEEIDSDLIIERDKKYNEEQRKKHEESIQKSQEYVNSVLEKRKAEKKERWNPAGLFKSKANKEPAPELEPKDVDIDIEK